MQGEKGKIISSVFMTGKGKVRVVNEDSLIVGSRLIGCGEMSEPEICRIADVPFLAVADGVGGGPGGKEASFGALEAILENISLLNCEDPEPILDKAVEKLIEISALKPELSGLATTLAALYINLPLNCFMAFGCGDSRVYRQNGHSFQQITKDHSLVREMADSSLITEEEMLTHPMRNVITSSISGRNEKKTRYSSFSQSLKEKERFFLCTDGVWEYLDIKDLERCLQTKDIFSAAEDVTDVILSSPATDNFTFIVTDIG